MAMYNLPTPTNNTPPTVKVKSTGVKKMKDVFIASDKDEFWASFTDNLLFPSLQSLLIRLAHGAIDIWFNGRSEYTYNGYTYNGYTTVNPYHNVGQSSSLLTSASFIPQPPKPIGKTGVGYCLEEITFVSWETAQNLINVVNDTIRQNKIIDVYSFLELAAPHVPGLQPPDYTDRAYGWTEVMNISPQMNREGRYFLPMTKPHLISQGGKR